MVFDSQPRLAHFFPSDIVSLASSPFRPPRITTSSVLTSGAPAVFSLLRLLQGAYSQLALTHGGNLRCSHVRAIFVHSYCHPIDRDASWVPHSLPTR